MQTATTHSERETIERGVEFAKSLKPGDVVALYGDLGSGKTRFAQGVCQGLGVREHVASPTFTIINEYQADAVNVYHFDFYRMTSLREIRDVGFEEYLSRGGVCLIEWAEKAAELLPPQRYDIRFEQSNDPDSRIISMTNNVAVAS